MRQARIHQATRTPPTSHVSVASTVPEVLAAAAVLGLDDPFLFWGERPGMSFADFELSARRFAGGLRRRGILPGERIAILMDNRPEFLTTAYGAMLAGVVYVPINTHLTPAEAGYIAAHSEACIVVCEPGYLPLIRQIPAWHELEFVVVAPAPDGATTGDGEVVGEVVGEAATLPWAEFLEDPIAPSSVKVRGDDLAVIQYTSGTTAFPKGAMLTHQGLVIASRARSRHLSYDTTDTLLIVSPLFHLNAQFVVLMCLESQCRVVLQEKFSASRFWNDVQRYGITTFNAMDTIPRILLSRDVEPAEQDNPLRTVVGGLPPELHRDFERRFAVTFIQVYALTEDPMSVLGPRNGFPPEWSHKIASDGHPTEPEVHKIRIVDDSGQVLPPGVIGEIVKRSPAMMTGYFKNPEESAAALRNGWLYTGDLGYLDEDGFLYFVDRKKDALRRSGEMIAAAEVEAAILSHPAVAGVAVIGVPDPMRGQEVKAFVELTVGRSRDDVSPEEILEHCAQRLADFKVPRYLEYRQNLPRTATLKISKETLRVSPGVHAEDVFDRERHAPVQPSSNSAQSRSKGPP